MQSGLLKASASGRKKEKKKKKDDLALKYFKN